MRKKFELLIIALLTHQATGAQAEEALCTNAKCREVVFGGATSFLQTVTTWALGRDRRLAQEEAELRHLRNEIVELKEASAATSRQLAEGAVLPSDTPPSLNVPATPYAPQSQQNQPSRMRLRRHTRSRVQRLRRLRRRMRLRRLCRQQIQHWTHTGSSLPHQQRMSRQPFTGLTPAMQPS